MKPTEIRDENGLAAFLDTMDLRLKELGHRKGLAHFHQLLGEPHEDLTRLNTEFVDLLLTDENDRIVDYWKTGISDSRLNRRLKLFADTILSSRIGNDPELFEISHPIEQKIISFQPEMGGKIISRSEQGKILESEPDRSRRRTAYYAGKALDERIEFDVVRLFEKRNELAVKLGYPDYVALGLKLQEIDENELRELFEQVKTSTEDIWTQTCRRIVRDMGIDAIEPWDLSYYIHTVLKSPAPERFPKKDIIPTFKAELKKAGGDLEKLPIRVIERDIPYGGLCMTIEFGKDIRILANPRDGLQWYDAVFHEFGHAIHGSLLDTSSYIVAGGDPSFFWEGVAGMYERIVHEPSFLKGTFGLDDDQIDQIRHQTRLSRILWFRRIAVSCLLEWAVYRGETDPRGLLAELTKEYLGLSVPDDTGWAGNTLYTTHPLYSQNYLLMDVMALHTIEAIREKFGAYPGPDLFEFVNMYYVKPGGWIPWREKIRSATGKDLTADALGRYLSA
ncbi:hypothetical protein JXA40_12545 [bacterium]|nr:hypothetical protein [candidate division CSSED10-310 bacterium]